MAIIKQEITSKGTIDTYFARVGTWNRFHNEGQTNYHLGFGVLYQEDLKDNDILEITIKTPIDGTFSDGMWISVWKSNDVNIEPSFSVNWSPTENTFNEEQKAEWTKLLEKIKTASPTNPVRFAIKIGTVVITPPKITYGNIVILDDGLYIDYKKVKALNTDGKNFKQFAIDGHIYDFRRANLPADEQTELQVLIDGYDWTHLSATGKALAANSLTWDQISGEQAIHAGVTITGITHPAIDADGTLVATISFSRLLSDGTTDLATKQVNIAFVLIKAAPLAVWYGDQNGNVYKNGVKTYLSTGSHQIKYIVSKGEDVWYSANSSGSGKVYKNGVEIHDGSEIFTIAIDKDENVYYGGKDKNIYKNGTSIFTCSDWVQSIVIDKDGNWYAADQGRKLYKNGTEITSPSGTRIEKISVYKDGSILIGDYDGWLFENQTQLSKLSNQIFAVLYDKNKNKFAIANDSTLYKNQTSLYSGVYTSGDVSINSVNGDVYYTSTDKKIYKNGVAIYTSEGSYPVVSVNNEFGSRTGYWPEQEPLTLKHTDYSSFTHDGDVPMMRFDGISPAFYDDNTESFDMDNRVLLKPVIIEFSEAFSFVRTDESVDLQINFFFSQASTTGSRVRISYNYPSKTINFLAGHKYKFEQGKDPVDLGAY